MRRWSEREEGGEQGNKRERKERGVTNARKGGCEEEEEGREKGPIKYPFEKLELVPGELSLRYSTR
jgi:hypothetical protein